VFVGVGLVICDHLRSGNRSGGNGRVFDFDELLMLRQDRTASDILDQRRRSVDVEHRTVDVHALRGWA
jgi:hypothetical protein